jgi:hypothetical protein
MILLKMRDLVLNFLDRLGRKRIIMDRFDNEPYLERYYVLFNTRHHTGFNVYIHKFLKGDPDDVHDHPWPYATFILAGGYYEWVPVMDDRNQMIGQRQIWRGPGHFRVCKPDSYHRIELKPGITAWTLFMPGPHKRQWGFLVDNKWIHNDEYLAQKKIECAQK